MKSNDLVKYLTIQVVEHLDNPNPIPKKVKENRSISSHWFGIIPISLKLAFMRFKNR